MVINILVQVFVLTCFGLVSQELRCMRSLGKGIRFFNSQTKSVVFVSANVSSHPVTVAWLVILAPKQKYIIKR